MPNTLHLIQLPTRMSGMRHGGARLERRHRIYINGKLHVSHREGAEESFRWATGDYYDRGLKHEIDHLENVLGCKCQYGKFKVEPDA